MSSSDQSEPSGKEPVWRQYEKQAAVFFNEQKFELLETNWRTGRLEIDLIVRRDNLIVFVEVKSGSSKKFGHPVERIDEKKMMNLTRAAQQYIEQNNITGCDLRFDVVTFSSGQLEHFPNAFEAREQ